MHVKYQMDRSSFIISRAQSFHRIPITFTSFVSPFYSIRLIRFRVIVFPHIESLGKNRNVHHALLFPFLLVPSKMMHLDASDRCNRFESTVAASLTRSRSLNGAETMNIIRFPFHQSSPVLLPRFSVMLILFSYFFFLFCFLWGEECRNGEGELEDGDRGRAHLKRHNLPLQSQQFRQSLRISPTFIQAI